MSAAQNAGQPQTPETAPRPGETILAPPGHTLAESHVCHSCRTEHLIHPDGRVVVVIESPCGRHREREDCL